MPDPVLSRSMFGGAPAGAPTPEVSQIAPKGQAAERAGLYAVAKATDEFSNQVQGAQDYEQLMNTIRGDNKTIEDRRSELAGIVGLADAQKTPVSVLTVIQPAIELLQQKTPQGGITSLVDDGSEEPSEPEQEPMRFAKGGLVQRFAEGGLANSVSEYDRMLQQRLGPERSIDDYVAERERILGGQDNSNLNANLALMGYGARVASTPGNLITALAAPLPDFGKELSGIAEKKSDRNRAIRMNALEARDKDKDKRQTAGIDALKTAFTEYNSNKRTGMQIDATAQENRLTRDFTRGENAANRDLTREEGGANRSLTREEGGANRGLTREENAANRSLTREENSANRDLTREEGGANRGLTREENAANRGLTREENAANRGLTREEGAANRGVTTSEGAANRQQQTNILERQQQFQTGQTKIQLNAHPEQSYIVQNGASTQLVRAKPTESGWVDATTGNALPQNAVPLNENTFRMFGGQKADPKDAKNFVLADGTKAVGIQVGGQILGLDGKPLPAGAILDQNNDISQPFNMVTEDPSAPAGLRPIMARQRGNVTEVNENGKWLPLDPSRNYARGELKDFVNPQSGNGQTTWSPTMGPMAGKSYTIGPGGGTNINSDRVPSPNDLQGTPVQGQQRSNLTVTPDVAPAVQAANSALQSHNSSNGALKDKFTIGAITGEGSEGRFTRTLEKPYVTWDRMSQDDKNESLKKINSSQGFLKASEEFLKAIPEAVGPLNQVKSFSTNVIAPFVPEKMGAQSLEYLKTEQAKRQLQELRQQLRQSQSLNPRFPVGELNVIDELAQDPDKFFANPKAGMARLQETIRVTRNNMEFERARLENRQPLYLDRIPMGNNEDPFTPKDSAYLLDLKKQGKTKGLIYQDPKGNLIQLD